MKTHHAHQAQHSIIYPSNYYEMFYSNNDLVFLLCCITCYCVNIHLIVLVSKQVRTRGFFMFVKTSTNTISVFKIIFITQYAPEVMDIDQWERRGGKLKKSAKRRNVQPALSHSVYKKGFGRELWKPEASLAHCFHRYIIKLTWVVELVKMLLLQ